MSRVLNSSDATSALQAGRATTLLPEGIIHDDEVIVLLLRPSVLYIPLSCFTGLVGIALATFFLAYLSRWQPAWISWSDTGAFALGIGLAALRLGWQVLEWWSRVYVLTDRRIIRRMGVLRVAVFETALRNVQHTSVFARLRERIFGLGSIGFATAGSDVFDAFWVSVRQPFKVHKIVVEAIRRARP